MTVQGLNAALVPIVFLYLLWKREWTWTGLFVALCSAGAGWAQLNTLADAVGSADIDQRALAFGAAMRAALFLGAAVGALRRPSTASTFLIVGACLFLGYTGANAIYRDLFGLDPAGSYAIGGRMVPDWLGLPVMVLFGLGACLVGLPWCLARQSNLRASLVSAAHERYAIVFGLGIAAFVIVSCGMLAWAYVGHGPFSGERLQPALAMETNGLGAANLAVWVIMGAGMFVFWAFPRHFIEQAAKLIEASERPDVDKLADITPPMWRSLAESLDLRRDEARRSNRAAEEARAQLAAFFDHAPVAMTLGDTKGRIIRANAAVAQAYGRSVETLPAMPVSEIAGYWPEIGDLLAAHQAALTTGKAQRLAAPFKPAGDREPLVYDVAVFPIFGSDGTVIQIGSLGVDVTEQERSRQELARSRGTIQAFFENIPAMTFIIGPDRNYVSANSYAIDNYGFEFLSPKSLLGKSDLTGTPDHWHPIIAEAHRTVMEDGKPHEVETSIDMPGGTLSLYVSRFPIRNAEGEVTHVGGLIFDRTAERRASDQVAATREALHQSEKLAALGQLLAGVAHELNNPLTVVVGRSAILEEKLKATPHGKAIADLREAADRCNRIVRTFLAMARQSAPRRAAVQVGDAIEAALDMTAYGLRSSGIELVRKFDENLPEVDGDEDQLVQVFTNLLINARHALEEHRPEGGKVTIATRVKGDKLLVEIADNGPGVSAELVSRIFEPFFTTKAVGDGTGMGLAMSRGMIEEHGGRLLYSDAKGGGAVFTVELPITAALANAKPEGDSEQPHEMGRGRVLVIDDEPSIRGLLVEILEGIELDCSECGDGAAALELLGRQDFDLVFCDVRMPVMDGIRFRQHLADTHPALLDRLVFISGDVLQSGSARRAEIAGHAFVEKPFNPAEVRALALSLLDGQGDTP
ncbi:ATP-binding protein [Novosphingobium sp.]|uniref:hybrid sensor histidine kinase/response regulator n=1 Tax=Novosphingobium sp. TaxID=1874826 RepID=UPI0025FAB0D8|nr:ATP-binding protein [Novosphingobium sp.]MCC6926272.1 PAS domain-containing protein [Novosphingobium sp.]